jgi:sodium-dependent phosphate cotransporter
VKTVREVLVLLLLLWVFLLSISLMSDSFKLMGGGFAKTLLSTTSNPFVGLLIGILATSLMQSSSATTSIVVGMVAGSTLSVRHAIPIVMGANVGTTVTNTLVSLGHITRRQEFDRAFSGAIVHDIFNLLAVAILFPLEMQTHYLERLSSMLAGAFAGVGGLKLLNPLNVSVKPFARFVGGFLVHPPIILAVALFLLFISLWLIVRKARGLALPKIEALLDGYLFSTALRSFVLGIVFTAAMQSSSITTSLVVPLVGAGLLTVEKIFPYMLGANVGTTVTAMLASLVTRNPVAIQTAFTHLLFNLSGICILYPMRKIPITIAKSVGARCSGCRGYAVLWVVLIFLVVPLFLVLIAR